MSANNTPVETLADALRAQQSQMPVLISDVLVPEQCMLIYIDGKPYHVTVESVDG